MLRYTGPHANEVGSSIHDTCVQVLCFLAKWRKRLGLQLSLQLFFQSFTFRSGYCQCPEARRTGAITESAAIALPDLFKYLGLVLLCVLPNSKLGSEFFVDAANHRAKVLGHGVETSEHDAVEVGPDSFVKANPGYQCGPWRDKKTGHVRGHRVQGLPHDHQCGYPHANCGYDLCRRVGMMNGFDRTGLGGKKSKIRECGAGAAEGFNDQLGVAGDQEVSRATVSHTRDRHVDGRVSIQKIKKAVHDLLTCGHQRFL